MYSPVRDIPPRTPVKYILTVLWIIRIASGSKGKYLFSLIIYPVMLMGSVRRMMSTTSSRWILFEKR